MRGHLVINLASNNFNFFNFILKDFVVMDFVF